MSKWKELLFGQPEPDMNQKETQERAERIRGYGKTFGERSGIAWLGSRIIGFANEHRLLFMALVFVIIFGCFLVNACRFVTHYTSSQSLPQSVERLDSVYQDRLFDKR